MIFEEHDDDERESKSYIDAVMQEGSSTFRMGGDRSDNPYGEDHIYHSVWESGFTLAFMKMMEHQTDLLEFSIKLHQQLKASQKDVEYLKARLRYHEQFIEDMEKRND